MSTKWNPSCGSNTQMLLEKPDNSILNDISSKISNHALGAGNPSKPRTTQGSLLQTTSITQFEDTRIPPGHVPSLPHTATILPQESARETTYLRPSSELHCVSRKRLYNALETSIVNYIAPVCSINAAAQDDRSQI